MQNVGARDMFADDRPEGIAIGVFPPVKQPGHKVGDQPVQGFGIQAGRKLRLLLDEGGHEATGVEGAQPFVARRSRGCADAYAWVPFEGVRVTLGRVRPSAMPAPPARARAMLRAYHLCTRVPAPPRVRGRPGIEDQALVVDVHPLDLIDRGEGRKKPGIDVGFRSMHGA